MHEENEITTDSEKSKATREFLLNQKSVLEMSDYIAYHDLPLEQFATLGLSHDWGQSPIGRDEFIKGILDTMATHMRRNFQQIYEVAESPIEIFLLCSLHFALIRQHPYIVEFTGPIDIETYPALLRKYHQHALDLWTGYSMFRDSQGETGIGNLGIFAKRLCGFPGIDDAEAQRATSHITRYHLFNLYSGFQISLQPSLHLIDGRQIRPDIYIWRLPDPGFKLIIECDGFKHHSDRTSFSKDRVRDRSLQEQGFKVFRFSGHEIYHNPLRVVSGLVKYLLDEWEKSGMIQDTDLFGTAESDRHMFQQFFATQTNAEVASHSGRKTSKPKFSGVKRKKKRR